MLQYFCSKPLPFSPIPVHVGYMGYIYIALEPCSIAIDPFSPPQPRVTRRLFQKRYNKRPDWHIALVPFLPTPSSFKSPVDIFFRKGNHPDWHIALELFSLPPPHPQIDHLALAKNPWTGMFSPLSLGPDLLILFPTCTIVSGP